MTNTFNKVNSKSMFILGHLFPWPASWHGVHANDRISLISVLMSLFYMLLNNSSYFILNISILFEFHLVVWLYILVPKCIMYKKLYQLPLSAPNCFYMPLFAHTCTWMFENVSTSLLIHLVARNCFYLPLVVHTCT